MERTLQTTKDRLVHLLEILADDGADEDALLLLTGLLSAIEARAVAIQAATGMWPYLYGFGEGGDPWGIEMRWNIPSGAVSASYVVDGSHEIYVWNSVKSSVVNYDDKTVEDAFMDLGLMVRV